jgi:hypothetical protein
MHHGADQLVKPSSLTRTLVRLSRRPKKPADGAQLAKELVNSTHPKRIQLSRTQPLQPTVSQVTDLLSKSPSQRTTTRAITTISLSGKPSAWQISALVPRRHVLPTKARRRTRNGRTLSHSRKRRRLLSSKAKKRRPSANANARPRSDSKSTTNSRNLTAEVVVEAEADEVDAAASVASSEAAVDVAVAMVSEATVKVASVEIAREASVVDEDVAVIEVTSEVVDVAETDVDVEALMAVLLSLSTTQRSQVSALHKAASMSRHQRLRSHLSFHSHSNPKGGTPTSYASIDGLVRWQAFLIASQYHGIWAHLLEIEPSG